LLLGPVAAGSIAPAAKRRPVAPIAERSPVARAVRPSAAAETTGRGAGGRAALAVLLAAPTGRQGRSRVLDRDARARAAAAAAERATGAATWWSWVSCSGGVIRWPYGPFWPRALTASAMSVRRAS